MATPEEREAIRQASLKEHGFPPSGTNLRNDPALGVVQRDAYGRPIGVHDWSDSYADDGMGGDNDDNWYTSSNNEVD